MVPLILSFAAIGWLRGVSGIDKSAFAFPCAWQRPVHPFLMFQNDGYAAYLHLDPCR